MIRVGFHSLGLMTRAVGETGMSKERDRLTYRVGVGNPAWDRSACIEWWEAE